MPQRELVVAKTALQPLGFKYFRQCYQGGDDWWLYARQTPDHWPYTQDEAPAVIKSLEELSYFVRWFLAPATHSDL